MTKKFTCKRCHDDRQKCEWNPAVQPPAQNAPATSAAAATFIPATSSVQTDALDLRVDRLEKKMQQLTRSMGEMNKRVGGIENLLKEMAKGSERQ